MAETPRRRRSRREDPPRGQPHDDEASGERREPVTRAQRPARSVVFVSSKGGLGASLLATNTSIYLAQLGNRVVLADADPSAGTLHTFLGTEPPRPTLFDFISRKTERLEDLCVETRVEGLELLSGASDPVAAPALSPSARAHLLDGFSRLSADYLVIDAGSRTSPHTLELFLGAKLGVLIVTPEPSSVEAAYRFLAAAFFRRLLAQSWPAAVERRWRALQEETTGTPFPGPIQLLEEAQSLDPESAQRIERELWYFRPAILVNQARARGDGEVGEAIRAACRRKLGLWVEPIGQVDYDDDVWISVRRRKPLLLEKPDSLPSQQVQQAAHRMLANLTALEALPPEPVGRIIVPPLEAQTHYELLGLQPGASEDEIRRAQKRMRLIYADDSVGLYGLYRPEEIERVQRRLAEAYECLIDVDRRRAYDLAVVPAGHPGRAWIEEAAARARPTQEPPPEATPETPREPALPTDPELSGAWLRGLRESRGINLADIATRTKISLQSLQWIEDDAFDKMAAPVYVRGFVLEFARCLKLDAERVARAYVERYRLWLENQAARMR